MLLSEYLSEWLDSKCLTLERSTYEAYTVYIHKHMIPYFEPKKIELEELKPKQVLSYCQHLQKNGRTDGKGGLGRASVKKHLCVLKQALNEAVLLEYIDRNPALPIKLPRVEHITQDVKFLTLTEAQDVINAFHGHKLKPVVVLALYYGLRRSEVLGLKWSAVDFKNNTLTVQHTVVKNLSIIEKDRTKTESSRRTFQLLPKCKEMLSELRAFQKNQNPNGYIFCWEDGRLFRPDYITRAFKRVLRLHGLPDMRFHDLRHNTASILFEQGWQLEDVKNWLGHSDIETTSNIYLHYGRSRKIMLADEMKNLFQI
ncbi:MAG: site-specific integrase [Ruminococcaceae bacterium]|nr:site-specific integrase [Oscillospiraceae bacterium]